MCVLSFKLLNAFFSVITLLSLLPQVDRQSQFIQGYRVLYRQTSGLPSPGPWQNQDVKVPSERSVLLSSLKKGIVYEIKVRPYFNEFQGMDSESKTARTTEEGETLSNELHFACFYLCIWVFITISMTKHLWKSIVP